MSRYRQSGFDPNMHEQPGAPLRPYNMVQWLGVAVAVVGLLLFLAHLAGKLGWIAPVEPARFGFLPMFIGMILINSRRGPSTLVGSEQLEKNRRTLLITAAILVAILGVALAIEFTGA